MAVYYKYSTGPVENALEVNLTPGASSTVFVKALNNSTCNDAKVRVKLFGLNGRKRLLFNQSFTLGRFSSNFVILDVAALTQFEVQIFTSRRDILVSAWGKAANGKLVAAHRFTQQELTKARFKG